MTVQACAIEARFPSGETAGPGLATEAHVRPRSRLRYRAFLEILNDDAVYTPATILMFGLAAGLNLPGVAPAAIERRRVRVALGRFCRYHGFAIPGDGLVLLPGQGARAGWFGWRWKRAAKVATAEASNPTTPSSPSARTADQPE